MERYAGLPRCLRASNDCPNLLSTSGGAGTATPAWFSGAWITRCGARRPHNPVRMLWMLPRAALERAAQDHTWLQLYDRALAGLDAARSAHFTWCAEQVPDLKGQSIAYFSAEFALHQSLPIYAGGLGVLAGDHCKEAGDLGVPLIGVGFMYPQGYFHQHITADGWQEEGYEKLNWADTPIEQALTPTGEPVIYGRPSRRPHGARGRVARAPGPGHPLPARHRPRRERPLGPGPFRRACTAATAKRACSRRSSSAWAGSARFAILAVTQPSGISTKAMRDSWCCSVSGNSSTRACRSMRHSTRCVVPPSSRRTHRCLRATTRSTSSWWKSTWQAPGVPWAPIGRSSSRSGSTTTATARSST